jgi:hypothetical protein
VNFDNHGRTMKFTASATRAALGKQIRLTAEVKGAREVYFYTTGRRLERVTSGRGLFTYTVDTDTLGSGPVTLRALARGNGGVESHVLAAPINLRIDAKR